MTMTEIQTEILSLKNYIFVVILEGISLFKLLMRGDSKRTDELTFVNVHRKLYKNLIR